MTASDPETDELLCLAGEGDESAVQRLLVRYRERLRRMVQFRMDERLKPRFDPSDVVQEAMISATQNMPRYLKQRPLPFYPWLRQIAWDRLMDLQRRHLHVGARSVAREERCRVSDASVAALARQLIASGSSPSRRFARNEIRDRVRQALDAMSADDRELLLMRHLEQLRVAEIAAVLRITEAAVKSRLRRALERLQNVLGNDFAEDRR